MKKLLTIVLLTLMLFVIALPALADPDPVLLEEATVITTPTAEIVTIVEPEPMPDPTPTPTPGPWTWAYLATIAGATAATLLIVQFMKVPLDKVWKIPTRLFVYIIALVIMTVATAFTSGLDVNSFLLCLLNAFIVALAAYGSYELTFAQSERH